MNLSNSSTHYLTLLFSLSLLVFMPLSAQATELEPNTVASVNGQELSLAMYEFLLGSRQREDQEGTELELTEDQLFSIRAQAKQDLVLTEVLAQEALRLKVDQIEANKIEIDLARQTLLAQLMVRKIMETINITEQDIRAVYDAEKSTSLYRFNLWITPSKEESEKLLSHLRDKNAFTHTYEKIETPWLDQTELEPSVVSIVGASKVGDFVDQTIHQDGVWKVVQLIDKNRFDKPPYLESRDVIKADLIQARVDEEIQRLSMNADIQINPLHY
jgi:SurA-like N-terminal domain